MSFSSSSVKKPPVRHKNLWFERVMAIAATANLCLVMFDLTYVSWRDFWLRGTFQFLTVPLQVPFVDDLQIPRLYDPIKGIEPNRDTRRYLDTVTALENQVAQSGLQSPATEQILADLRRQSSEMIESDPFRVANKSGTLEKIKNRMRDRIFGTTKNVSSKESFNRFWSAAYLSSRGWTGEMQWFKEQIRPLIATNYFRGISETGNFTDNFGVLDVPFTILFGLEFLARTFYLSRTRRGINWLDGMLWRWYDVPLFFPFWLLLPGWAWVRVLPVAIRLHQSQLVDMERVKDQATQGFVATIAEEITEVVVVQVINQIQGSVRRGEVAQLLRQVTEKRAYVDLNNRNEVEEIAGRLANVTLYQVLPKIQPDLEALLRHNVDAALKQLPLYSGVKGLPGMEDLMNQVMTSVISQVTETVYSAAKSALEDPVGAQLAGRLSQNFVEVLSAEVQQQHTLQELQSLLTDLLEEVKVNYVRRLSEEDVEVLLDETRQLQQGK